MTRLPLPFAAQSIYIEQVFSLTLLAFCIPRCLLAIHGQVGLLFSSSREELKLGLWLRHLKRDLHVL